MDEVLCYCSSHLSAMEEEISKVALEGDRTRDVYWRLNFLV